MKNRKLLSLLGVALLSLMGCGKGASVDSMISKEYKTILTECFNRIKDHLEYYYQKKPKVSELGIYTSYGVYNEAYVFTVIYSGSSLHPGNMWSEPYRNVEKNYSFYPVSGVENAGFPFVYKNRTFYSFEESFDLGILDCSDPTFRAATCFSNYIPGCINDEYSSGNLLYRSEILNSLEEKYKEHLGASIMKNDKVSLEYIYGIDQKSGSGNDKINLVFGLFSVPSLNQMCGDEYVQEFKINNKSFSIIGNHLPVAYSIQDDKFYSLEECFEKDWISDKDLEAFGGLTNQFKSHTIGFWCRVPINKL